MNNFMSRSRTLEPNNRSASSGIPEPLGAPLVRFLSAVVELDPGLASEARAADYDYLEDTAEEQGPEVVEVVGVGDHAVEQEGKVLVHSDHARDRTSHIGLGHRSGLDCDHSPDQTRESACLWTALSCLDQLDDLGW
eukprot:CAMPEP_0171489284 /NCGR_PEP_ID=MMETSP0958-20121227/2672_1 /TAXON_ID=87120 /ORGANISM="Aurantiochytrium limacinum, Strain ATCCMYA-1381" /LENGTH=136 /DNA_ID=CAMNT_0012022481 /DNA_START=1280 /DNA_END=1689 /DNA_ORIENTATION=-